MHLFDAAEGDLRRHYDAVDWAATPLGSVESWSPALRSSVELALNTRFAVTLLWGPEYVLVYNDAYAEMIADKHPSALGRPCADVFPEAWDVIEPMLDSVRAGEGATWVEDFALPLDRNGALTEAYFTFSYSPVGDGSGHVEGCIDISAESTGLVVAQRRIALLARLEHAVAGVRHVAEFDAVALSLLRASDDFAEVEVVPADSVAAHGRVLVRPLRAVPNAPGPDLMVRLTDLIARDDATEQFVSLVAASLMQAYSRVTDLEAEAELSAALQRSLLTSPGRLEGFDVAVRYQPARDHAQVGGDWFDAFTLPGGSVVLAVGDVMGHDLDAAAVMGQIRNLLRGIAHSHDPSPATALHDVDGAIANLAVGALATAVMVRIEPADGPGCRHALWSNAGHPLPLVRRADGRVEQLDSNPELLLGLDPSTPRSDHSLRLDPGDTLLLYTDGLVERRDRSIDDVVGGLATRLADADVTDLEALCDHLLAERRNAGDDIALVLLRPTSGG